MALKLLVFGLPGGGKSTIAHSLATNVESRNWESFHFSDHVILRDMFLADIEQKQFRQTEHGGFDVTDIKAFDTALKKLELIIKIHLLNAKQEELVLIEFARNNYRWAFQQFSDTFLQDAYFLYLDVETDICKRRIQERIENPSSEDDGRFIAQILADEHNVEKERVTIIDNNGSLSESLVQVYKFVDTMCGFETS
jgi:adenylate kinase family enzyme